MANFCSKCGSVIAEGNSFCTKCGASIGGATAPAATAAPAAGVPPKSGSAPKVILIVLGVFIGLGILAGVAVTFGIWRLSRGVRVDRAGQVTINTPGGKMTVGTAEVREADLGLPLYPNAKRQEGSVQLSTAEGSMSTYLFKTSDTPAQVMAFYHGKLSPKTSFLETPDGGIITSDNSATVGFMITVGRDNSDAQTSISMLRGTSKKAQ